MSLFIISDTYLNIETTSYRDYTMYRNDNILGTISYIEGQQTETTPYRDLLFYDPNGRLHSLRLESDLPTSYYYFPNGRLRSLRFAWWLTSLLLHHHDPDGRLLIITTPTAGYVPLLAWRLISIGTRKLELRTPN